MALASTDSSATVARIRRRRQALALVAGAALSLNTACYTYMPVMGGVAPVGRDAMIELTSEGSTTMQPVLGPRIHRIEGRVTSAETDGAAFVSVESLTSRDGLSIPFTSREAIRVPRDAVVRYNVREIDRKKSWLAGGLVGGAFAIVVVTALAKARSRNSGGPGKIGAAPPELRAP